MKKIVLLFLFGLILNNILAQHSVTLKQVTLDSLKARVENIDVKSKTRFEDTLSVDIINEFTTANGVVVDGLTIKDTGINFESGATTRIFKDGSNNLSFTDAVTGTKTLAELVENTAPAYGIDGQVPYMNSTGTGYLYHANFFWNGVVFSCNNGGTNTFIGQGSGIPNLTTASRNVLIGDESGSGLSSGFGNVHLGSFAGYQTSTGGYNVFVGFETGESNVSGSNNTYIGDGAGQTASDNLSNNVLIGHEAGFGITTSNILVIDNQERSVNPLTSYLIYGEFNATPSSQLLRVNATLDHSLNPNKPKIYNQASEPDIPNDTMSFWKDSDDSKYYLILDIGGAQKKIELL